jgi:hypothetical protein
VAARCERRSPRPPCVREGPAGGPAAPATALAGRQLTATAVRRAGGGSRPSRRGVSGRPLGPGQGAPGPGPDGRERPLRPGRGHSEPAPAARPRRPRWRAGRYFQRSPRRPVWSPCRARRAAGTRRPRKATPAARRVRRPPGHGACLGHRVRPSQYVNIRHCQTRGRRALRPNLLLLVPEPAPEATPGPFSPTCWGEVKAAPSWRAPRWPSLGP